MASDDQREGLAALRQVIARIGGDAAPAAAGTARVTLGGSARTLLPLDRLLGGGLRRGTLIEVVAARVRDSGAASGFALALAARFAAGTARPVVWILEDGAQGEVNVEDLAARVRP